MKFLLRSLLVLAIAVVSGLALYYAVQALPGSSTSAPTGIGIEPRGEGNATQNPAPRPEGPEKDRGGIRWRSLLGIARRTIVFAVGVFVAVIAERFVFRKRANRNNKSE